MALYTETCYGNVWKNLKFLKKIIDMCKICVQKTRNRWQDEVREDGRLAGGKGWKERVCNKEEW